PGAGGRFGVGKGWTRLRGWPPCSGVVTGTAASGGAPSLKAFALARQGPSTIVHKAQGQLDSARPRRRISREAPTNRTRERDKIKILYVTSRDTQELAAKPGVSRSRRRAGRVAEGGTGAG